MAKAPPKRPAPVPEEKLGQELFNLIARGDADTDEGLNRVYDLIERGADVNKVCKQRRSGLVYDETCLSRAVAFKSADLAAVLLAAGADTDFVDSSCRTMLMAAAQEGDAAMTRLLLDHKANPHIVNTKEKSVLMHAVLGQSPDIVRMILDCNVVVDFRDRWGNTALHMAARYGHRDIAGMLVRAGASLDILNDDNETPLVTALNHSMSKTAAEIEDAREEMEQKKAAEQKEFNKWLDAGGPTQHPVKILPKIDLKHRKR